MSIKIQCSCCGKINAYDKTVSSEKPRVCIYCHDPLIVPEAAGSIAAAPATPIESVPPTPASVSETADDNNVSECKTAQKNRRISPVNDLGCVGILLTAAVILIGLYIAMTYDKADQISVLVAEGNLANSLQQTGKDGKKVAVSSIKKQTDQQLAAEKEAARRKKYKAQKLTIKGTGYDFNRPADFVRDRAENIIANLGKSKVSDVWKNADDLSMKVWIGHDDNFLFLRFKVQDDIHLQKNDIGSAWMDDSVQVMLWAEGWSLQWEFTFALREDGPAGTIHMAPSNINSDRSRILNNAISITRAAKETTYDIKLPLNAIGLNLATLKKGFRFNALANDTDDDQHHRKMWIEIVEGIGQHKDIFASPWIKFEK